jgi:hypothetical protein
LRNMRNPYLRSWIILVIDGRLPRDIFLNASIE